MFKQNEIELNEEKHTYTVKGAEHLKFTSATTFIGDHFKPFNAEEIAKDLIKKYDKYKNKTPEQILNGWNHIAQLGTEVHKEIEDWIILWSKMSEDDYEPIHNKSRHGILWLQENLSRKYEVFPEVKLFSIKLQLAGTVDLIIRDPESGLFVMVDWKTNKKITNRAYMGQKGTHYATRFLEDHKLNKYALQMSLYTYLLEKYYGIKIHKRLLIHLRPNQTAYYPLGIKEYETEYLKPNIIKMVEERLRKKENNELFRQYS